MFGMPLSNRLDCFDYQINNYMFFPWSNINTINQFSHNFNCFPFLHLSSMIHHHICSLKLTRHSLNINMWVQVFFFAIQLCQYTSVFSLFGLNKQNHFCYSNPINNHKSRSHSHSSSTSILSWLFKLQIERKFFGYLIPMHRHKITIGKQ